MKHTHSLHLLAAGGVVKLFKSYDLKQRVNIHQDGDPVILCMMNSHSSHAGDVLAESLGCTPGFACYLTETVSGLELESQIIKEKAGGTVCIVLTYHVVNNKENASGLPLGRHLGSNATKSKPVPSAKKKSPSRRRRDRKRFHEFLERKKQRKINHVASSNNQESVSLQESVSKSSTAAVPSSPVQRTPPIDTHVTIEVPESITVATEIVPDPSAAVVPSPQSGPEEPTTAQEISPERGPEPESPVKRCICSVCRDFVDTDPLLSYHATCDNCGTPNTADNPLKPCARCMFRAYCSKVCQKSAWKAHHKAACSVEGGETAKLLRSTWTNSREIWLKHKLEPYKLP